MSDPISRVSSNNTTTKTNTNSTKVSNTSKKQNVNMNNATGSSTSAGKGTSVAAGEFSKETKAIVDQFYNAVYGLGTDDKSMTEALSKINEDNIMDVMRCWNKYHSNESGESFMEAFMWDAGHGDKKKYGKQIAAILRDKADSLGLYDQCKDEFSKIDKEMRAIFYISNNISEQYDSIIEKIAMKEGQSYGTAYKK